MSASPIAQRMLDPTSRRWTLFAAIACITPLLLALPGHLAWPIAVASAATSALAWRKPLPGLIRLLLTLLTVGAILAFVGLQFGRDTGCALLAAMLAIKPSETAKLRDARSLVGFALFAPFATFLLDQGPLSLVLGLIAACLSLAALQYLADMESGETRSRISLWRRLRSVGHLLLIGLPMALAAFWLFPRLSTPLWGMPDRALARPGLSDSMRPNDWLDLMTDDTPALRVRFFGNTPRRDQMYWRGPVLWRFNGEEWTQPSWARELPPAPAESGPVRWDYELEMEATDRRQLVSLDLLRSAPDQTVLAEDYSLRSAEPLSAVTRWRMLSAPPLTFEPRLRTTVRQAALQLPQGYNPRTIELARQWRREAGSNDLAVVQRALGWIHREFVYTLDTPPWGHNAIDEFLFKTKAGFCQHFSSSFVVLMRAAGIPARVVTGYAGGYRNPIGGYWVVRRSDAHAWAEVWLSGRGWVRVDPTAAVAPERVYDTLAERSPGAESLLGDLGNPAWNVADWLKRNWNDVVLGFDASRQERMFRPLGFERVNGQQLAILFAVAASLALLWMTWLSSRGQRLADPVLRAWHRLSARYQRLGLGREPYETAGDWVARVARTRPDLVPDLDELSRRFVNWRYAQHQPGERNAHGTRELVRALRKHRPRRSFLSDSA